MRKNKIKNFKIGDMVKLNSKWDVRNQPNYLPKKVIGFVVNIECESHIVIVEYYIEDERRLGHFWAESLEKVEEKWAFVTDDNVELGSIVRFTQNGRELHDDWPECYPQVETIGVVVGFHSVGECGKGDCVIQWPKGALLDNEPDSWFSLNDCSSARVEDLEVLAF